MESKMVTERVPVMKTVTVNEVRWENQMVTEMKTSVAA